MYCIDIKTFYPLSLSKYYILLFQHANDYENKDVDENSQNILNLINDTSNAASGNWTLVHVL